MVVRMAADRQRFSLGPAFSPVHSGDGLSQIVAQRISSAISTGLIADGDQLPAEERMAAEFNVSTASVRGALEILREQGLVVTRRGRAGGSFAQAPRSFTRHEVVRRFQELSTTELRDLGSEQTAIAGMCADLAARRAVAGNLARLDGLVGELRASKTEVAAARADSRFHIEVAVSCQSERLTNREVSLQAEYVDFLWTPGHAADRFEHAAEHEAIARAIRAEDATLARKLAEDHTLGVFHNLIGRRLRMTT